MIPYFHPPAIELGPLKIEAFGICAAIGIYVGARIAAGRAAREKLDPNPLIDWVLWGVLGGVLGGHFVHLFLYHPEELRDPMKILRVWDGLSSFGGLLGGLLVAVIYFRWRKVSLMSYGDALALGVAPGWGIARIGCFLVHDHPGSRTDFFLAVNFPDKAPWFGPRHDLGLYDAIALFLIAGLLYTLAKKGALKGLLLPVLAVTYNVQRFFTDFLRADDMPYKDARYLGLTPAQYIAVGLAAWGIYMLIRRPAIAGAGQGGKAEGKAAKKPSGKPSASV